MDIDTIAGMTAEEMRAELLAQFEAGFHVRAMHDDELKPNCGCCMSSWMPALGTEAMKAGYREAERRMAEEDTEHEPPPASLLRRSIRFMAARFVRPYISWQK